jgi:hypothetical protein
MSPVKDHCTGEAQQQFNSQSSIAAWVFVAAGTWLTSRCIPRLENRYSLVVFTTLYRFLLKLHVRWFLDSNAVPLYLKAEGPDIQAWDSAHTNSRFITEHTYLLKATEKWRTSLMWWQDAQRPCGCMWYRPEDDQVQAEGLVTTPLVAMFLCRSELPDILLLVWIVH